MKFLRLLAGAFVELNKLIWMVTPKSVRDSGLGLVLGRLIHKLVHLRGGRSQLTVTRFFRNRAELSQVTEIVKQLNLQTELNLTVVGCSRGAEVYSILYTLKKAFPSLKINTRAYDIDEVVVETAKSGRYKIDSVIFDKTNEGEMESLFVRDGEYNQIKDEYMQGIFWAASDPLSEPVISTIPKQDLVIANRLLFHMYKDEQRKAMKAISSMVRSGGYIFVVGADLDVRADMANKLKWIPQTEYIEEIHAGDDTMLVDWPFEYWGLEPLDKRHTDWQLRYCPVFKIP